MDKKLIRALVHNDRVVVEKLYTINKSIFLKFAQRYPLSTTEFLDIYQEAFIILRQHAIDGNLDTISSTLRTYLFGIAKKLIYKALAKH